SCIILLHRNSILVSIFKRIPKRLRQFLTTKDTVHCIFLCPASLLYNGCEILKASRSKLTVIPAQNRTINKTKQTKNSSYFDSQAE
ncbi:mCG145239, partial [Mus musculus]